jgi:tRNA threonylcarbamoyl adenosine modification protein YjeE
MPRTSTVFPAPSSPLRRMRSPGSTRVPMRSPTFVLHHVYRAGAMVLHHLDLYRLGPGADIRLLDVEDMLQSGGVVIVEWGEHAPHQDGSASLTIDIDEDGTRVISPPEGAPERLLGAWADGPHG